MKASEIREIRVDGSYGKDDTMQKLLREIAAQLSELVDATKDLKDTVRIGLRRV